MGHVLSTMEQYCGHDRLIDTFITSIFTNILSPLLCRDHQATVITTAALSRPPCGKSFHDHIFTNNFSKVQCHYLHIATTWRHRFTGLVVLSQHNRFWRSYWWCCQHELTVQVPPTWVGHPQVMTSRLTLIRVYLTGGRDSKIHELQFSHYLN